MVDVGKPFERRVNMSPKANEETPIFTEAAASKKSYATRTQCLRILGLAGDPTPGDIQTAYKGLVADMTPGVDANHSRVSVAKSLLAEVEMAYAELSA